MVLAAPVALNIFAPPATLAVKRSVSPETNVCIARISTGIAVSANLPGISVRPSESGRTLCDSPATFKRRSYRATPRHDPSNVRSNPLSWAVAKAPMGIDGEELRAFIQPFLSHHSSSHSRKVETQSPSGTNSNDQRTGTLSV